ELIRSLRRQLEGRERELADQKWVFEQFLKSPSWRLTAPFRWLKAWLTGGPPGASATSGSLEARSAGATARSLKARSASATARSLKERPPQADASGGEPEESTRDLKELFSALYQVQLRSFLTSNSSLELPRCENPEISV